MLINFGSREVRFRRGSRADAIITDERSNVFLRRLYRRIPPMLVPLEPLMEVALDPVVDVPVEPITGVLGTTGALLGAVPPEKAPDGWMRPNGIGLGTAVGLSG